MQAFKTALNKRPDQRVPTWFLMYLVYSYAEYDVETKTIPFLDLSVSIKDGKIVTDLYKKDTAVC